VNQVGEKARGTSPHRPPKRSRRQWGTAAILDAPVRDTGACVVAEAADLTIRRHKANGSVWLNGHPFRSPEQCVSVIARKLELLRPPYREEKPAKPPNPYETERSVTLSEHDLGEIARFLENATDIGMIGPRKWTELVVARLRPTE
jgi:hypothetical protein